MHSDWHSGDEPFLRPYAVSTPDLLADAAVKLLRDRGVSELSVGALARALNVSPQAILKDYPRARVIHLLCIAFGRRWVAWCGPDRRAQLPTRLPRTEAERHGVRVYVGLAELARGEAAHGRPEAAATLAEWGEEERADLAAALGEACGRRVTEEEVVGVHALVSGLRWALVQPCSTLTWEVAGGVLRRHLAELVVDNQLWGKGA